MWMTAMRWTTAEQARGERGQDHRDQVISDGEGGDYQTRGDNQGGSNDESADWSRADSEETEGSATDEEATTTGGTGWESATRTVTARGTLESTAEWPQGEAIAGGGDTGNPPPADADELGARGYHGARQA